MKKPKDFWFLNGQLFRAIFCREYSAMNGTYIVISIDMGKILGI